jgi:hypothetical protein
VENGLQHSRIVLPCSDDGDEQWEGWFDLAEEGEEEFWVENVEEDAAQVGEEVEEGDAELWDSKLGRGLLPEEGELLGEGEKEEGELVEELFGEEESEEDEEEERESQREGEREIERGRGRCRGRGRARW